jgi:hypothetical protein
MTMCKPSTERSARSVVLLVAVLLLASCTGGESDAQKTSQKGTPAASPTSAAEDAYIFGLGPVAMYKWYQVFAIDQGNLNRLGYSTAFTKPGELPGGSPNNDTYYGKGWLDLSVGPYVVSLPDFGERYYVFQLTDIYGFNFLNVGNSLSSGQKDAYKDAYTFALVPPGWDGDVPAGVERVDSPVRLVNVLYRIHVGNEATGGPEARRRQQETLILPLSDWEAGKRENIQVMPEHPVAPYKDVIAVGKNVVAADQRNLDFFVMLDNLLRFEPPWNAWDRQFVSEHLSALGIGGDKPFDPSTLTPDQAKQLMDGQESGFGKVLEKTRNVGVEVNGWQYTDPDAGLYHDDFLLRAAMIYTGGMYPSMQVSRYANLSVGPDGQPLVGSKPMVLTLPGNDMPPVTSFWSVTMYSMGSFDLVDNPIDRYLISSTSTGLDHDQDGSLTIYIQNEKPTEDKVSNWLPAPAGEYFLLFRWYAPTERVINLDYKLPEIR